MPTPAAEKPITRKDLDSLIQTFDKRISEVVEDAIQRHVRKDYSDQGCATMAIPEGNTGIQLEEPNLVVDMINVRSGLEMQIDRYSSLESDFISVLSELATLVGLDKTEPNLKEMPRCPAPSVYVDGLAGAQLREIGERVVALGYINDRMVLLRDFANNIRRHTVPR